MIRPTGLVDPEIEVRPAQGQVPHLLAQIKERVAGRRARSGHHAHQAPGRRLSAYIQEAGFRGRYLHSEIQTLERVEILNDLRKGDFDVLVGVNLLREGLDLPEVSMVAILDADKAGFLRSETSIIQMIGRAARNVNAKVDPLRRHDHARDAEGDGRNQAPPRDPGEVQRRARHHAADDQEGDPQQHRVGSESPPRRSGGDPRQRTARWIRRS